MVAAYFFAEKINRELNDNNYFKYIGAGIFITIGLISIIKKKSPQKGNKLDVDSLDKIDNTPHHGITRVRTYFALIGKGMGLNAINPGVLVYWIGASTYASETLNIVGYKAIYYFAATLSTMFAIDLLKIHFASKLHNKLTPRAIDRISIVVGAVLIFFGIVLCFKDINVNV